MEATQLRHDYIGTEHLLLGLLRQGENGAATVLIAQGVALEGVRQAVAGIVGLGKAEPVAVKGYSQRGREVVRGALALAKQQEQANVEPEHLLFALIEDRHAVAAMILAGIGVDLDFVRQGLVQQLVNSARP